MSTGNPGLIGKAIRIKGELHGEEDLIIEGKVEGTIALKKNHLILERSAVIAASVEVENITIKGQMNGNTSASNRVEITADAKVVGDIKAPRVVMAEGARFRGAVDMDVKLPAGLSHSPHHRKGLTMDGEKTATVLGPTVEIEGEIEGEEDLVIQGRIQGKTFRART